jgi:Glycosyltransferases involved in cell wall biogenesis
MGLGFNKTEMSTDISVIILTYNEEMHIKRCIENVKPWVRDVFVVDSLSTDRTAEIAEGLGARVFRNVWLGLYASQFNWALDNLPIRTEWVLRLDADEYLTDGLIEEIKAKLDALPGDVAGCVFNRGYVFMGRWIRRGGTYPVKLLRLFRHGKGRCEERMMDEHIELMEGRPVELLGVFFDHNLNDIGWWSAKHNGYALREAVDLLDIEYDLSVQEHKSAKNTEALGKQAAAKRAKKLKYARMPLCWRAFAYFLYRYLLKGGFLEGKEGFLWHFLQGWWYRTLVDAKIWEIKRESGRDREKMLALLRGKYGMKI